MNIKNVGQSFEQTLLKDKNVEHVVRFNEEFTTWQQRLVLGVASISTQPLFDYFNKDVDQETRNYSTARTMAKIIVGTTEGCLVRYMVIRYGKKNAFSWLKNADDKAVKQLNNFFEKRISHYENKMKLNDKDYKEYKNSLNNFKGYSGKLNNWIEAVKGYNGNFKDFDFKGEKTKDLNTFLGNVGGALSVVAAFGAALLIDIPMTNKALNWGMHKLFPTHEQKGDNK